MVRTYEKIKADTIAQFNRIFPGEKVHETVFSEWCLHMYCELIERFDLYKDFQKTGKML